MKRLNSFSTIPTQHTASKVTFFQRLISSSHVKETSREKLKLLPFFWRHTRLGSKNEVERKPKVTRQYKPRVTSTKPCWKNLNAKQVLSESQKTGLGIKTPTKDELVLHGSPLSVTSHVDRRCKTREEELKKMMDITTFTCQNIFQFTEAFLCFLWVSTCLNYENLLEAVTKPWTTDY